MIHIPSTNYAVILVCQRYAQHFVVWTDQFHKRSRFHHPKNCEGQVGHPRPVAQTHCELTVIDSPIQLCVHCFDLFFTQRLTPISQYQTYWPIRQKKSENQLDEILSLQGLIDSSKNHGARRWARERQTELSSPFFG